MQSSAMSTQHASRPLAAPQPVFCAATPPLPLCRKSSGRRRTAHLAGPHAACYAERSTAPCSRSMRPEVLEQYKPLRAAPLLAVLLCQRLQLVLRLLIHAQAGGADEACVAEGQRGGGCEGNLCESCAQGRMLTGRHGPCSVSGPSARMAVVMNPHMKKWATTCSTRWGSKRLASSPRTLTEKQLSQAPHTPSSSHKEF